MAHATGMKERKENGTMVGIYPLEGLKQNTGIKEMGPMHRRVDPSMLAVKGEIILNSSKLGSNKCFF